MKRRRGSRGADAVGDDSSLRILFVISRLDGTGGAGRSLAELIHGLKRAGVHAELACFRRSSEGLEDELVRADVPVHELEVDHLRTAIRRLRRIVRERRPDAIHTTMYAADQAGRFAAWGTGVPVVSSIVNPTHDAALLVDDCPRWRRRLIWALDGWTARHLTAHIHAVTRAVKESAVQGLRVPPSKVTVVYRSRDQERLGEPGEAHRRAARRSLGLDDEVVVLNIGRQEAQKGQVVLVDAFARIADARPTAVLLIAGAPGASTPALEARIRELSLDGRVRLLGHREDVGDLLAAADVFAFPSVYEGIGGVLLEAMALGIPIVASELPPLREITGDGDAALLVPADDRDAIAAAIARVLDDPALSERLSTRGRARYLEFFTPERATAGLRAMYEGVVSAT